MLAVEFVYCKKLREFSCVAYGSMGKLTLCVTFWMP